MRSVTSMECFNKTYIGLTKILGPEFENHCKKNWLFSVDDALIMRGRLV